MSKFKRAFVIVLDSYGIGREPDAPEFGDDVCNTLKSIVASPKYDTPNMKKLGLFNIDGVGCGTPEAQPIGSFARLRELSRGKDTTTGHWELAGIVSEQPMPTYPDGFPADLIAKLEEAFGKKILCNKPYSGTAVIHDYGQEQEKTGGLIVYTSADSVFQIAANEKDVPVEELYGYCKTARKILQGKHGVGRVIARPYIGEYPNYTRTSRRHDFSLDPTGDTMLDALARKGLATIGVGKISDIFAGRSVSRSLGINKDNNDGMEKTLKLMDEDFTGLCFVNLVDFDMQYGHRRNVDGYAAAATAFDKQLGKFMGKMKDDDVLMITADHGCDPGAPGTDHTREYVPLLIYGKNIKAGVNLGTYPTFAMLGATISDMFDCDLKTKGESLLMRIEK
ncbi:MAG: phosphopentomutase [Selenomonas sp.]|nr:phosphopentomutase [Selenomonadales bacterium]MDD7763105.1 phosphopentomutase [Selenomonadales bacterium]MDY5716829.1 phosphopentomutase [Selenomonas sp.]